MRTEEEDCQQAESHRDFELLEEDCEEAFKRAYSDHKWLCENYAPFASEDDWKLIKWSMGVK